MKVRVTKPKMSRGGIPNNRFAPKYLPLWNPAGENQAPDLDVRKTLGPVPEEDASLEAEGGETAYIPDLGGLPAHYDITGPRHSEGGTPLDLPPDSFIFSDTRSMKIPTELNKYFGKSDKSTKKFTPADLAKQYDINKFRKQLQDPDSDPIQVKTAEMMIANYNKKLGMLGLTQEGLKGFPDGIPSVAMPYLASYGIDPTQVLPLQPGTEDLSQDDQGVYQSGGNSFQNGPQGTGYRFGGDLPKAQDGIRFKTLSELRREQEEAQMAAAYPQFFQGAPGSVISPIAAQNPSLADYPQLTSQVATAASNSSKKAPNKSRTVSGITSWPGDRSDRSNRSKYSNDQWREFAKTFCPSCKTNEDVQEFILSSPEFKPQIDALHEKYGMPLAGKEVDGKLGHRWDFVFDKPEVAQVAAPVAKKPEQVPPIAISKVGPYKQASANAPWWLQDVIRTTGAAGDFLRLKKYLPWAPKVNPYVPQATFYDPTRELAANSEQAAIQTQGANAYGTPQQFSARSSAIQGQGAKNAADILGKYNNLNVGVANQHEAMAAGIYNQANEFNANTARDLYDKTTIANQQFDNAKNQARQELRGSFIDSITNRAQAQTLNYLYGDHYQFDPSSGGLTSFWNGDELQPGSSSNSNIAAIKSMQEAFPTWTPEQIAPFLKAGYYDENNDQRAAIMRQRQRFSR